MLKSLKKSVRLSLSDSNSYEKKEKKEPTKSASFSLRNLELTVKYMGYLPVSDARSLQTLKQAIRFVVQQRIRRTHSRFEMRNFQVIIYDLESEDTILDIPIQKVALCGKEFVKGFEKCFAVNVTTDDSHVCHVMQAATTYEAEKFLVKIAEAFEALGKMAKKSKQRKSTIPTQAAPTSKSTPASDEMARSDNGSQQRSRYSSNFLNVDNPNTLSTGISRDSHDGLSNSMETRQLPPIPKNFNYDNAEVSQSHHANESHGLQIRPLPPVPDVARNSSGHDDEDVANRETLYASLKNTVKKDEVEDPYSTIKNKLGEENPYSTVKNKRVDENPYSSVKNKSNEENPYSTVKDKLNEEDPYSSIKDIRKAKLKLALSQPGQENITTQGTPQYQTEDEEDPYSTVRTKTNSDNSKSDVVIQVRSPAGNLEVSAHANDSTRGNPAKQVDEQTGENKSGAVMAEFKASITPDLYEARKSYQSRRSIANQWTSYNVSEVFEEVGGDEQNDVKSNKKFYDPTDIYVNLHKYRMQNQNKSSSSRQYNDVTNKIDDKGDSEKVHQQSATKTNDSQVDGNLSVNQHKFYQSIKDVQSTYQKLKSKIKSNLVKQHNQQPTQLDTREAVRRVVSEIYKYDYRLDNSEKLKEIIDETSISVDSIDPETGYSLLHHSVSSESLSSINFFLERGANVNVQNRDKRTPLHVGVTTGNFSIVKRLLCHGADVTIKDTHGRTALHLVMGLQLDRKMMLLLVEYGARISEADSSSTRPVDIEPELRVIQREMILKCNDELCTIDVGAIFRIRSRVNSKSSVGSGTGSIKSIESRSNFSITNEEVRLKLGGIEENSNDNPDNLLAVPNKQQSDIPGSDEENVNYDIEFGDGSDKLTNFPNVLDAALHDSFDDQSEILSDESNTLKDSLKSEFIKATNEITESSTTVNKETTNVKLAPANTELQASHQSGGNSRRQITKENSSFSDNNKDDLVPVYQGENLMSDDNINDNEFSSDLDAWGGVFSEMDAWDDVFVEENSNLSCNRQGNNDLPDTSSLKLSIGHSFDQKPLSREDIIKNKISNVELIQTLKIENSYLEGPNNKAVLPDDPAELEDFDSKEIFGQEEKAAKNLRSLAILSKNPECHTIILSLLFAPNSILQKNNPKSSPRTLSVQLTALAHTESSVKSLPRYLASFIFTLCKSDGINSQKKSINSGIVNLLSDLLDSKADLIKKISLSLIWELLHIDSDREFCTVLSHFHVDPMLDLVAQCEAEQDMRADEFDPNAIDDMYRQYVLNSHNLKDK
ncbi:uncharacterized protein TRIADDRAFT_52031 [Trichoplax adhaerens]|uniref:Ankyrin repeat domain-containing protein 54 n=1 Tax=Trichoplax adhaerens TaxID=10228 RepID=B3RLK1_TRIAD|nr:predicted protein [Trichoplax adhaerens]EDV28789.1 predicted protein [Trichoplax adhaerens]|eukprot:XP_002107991.1 predicted protein [Trichoplax adhaerens]